MALELPYTRSIAETILTTSRCFPCLLLTGARQVGKTTLLKSLMPEGMKFVTLDNYLLAEQARQDPMGFLEEMGQPLFIDEIQYAPELFRAIKIKVDENRRNGMYWMAGSQRFRLMKNVSDSLAGRVGIMELYSFSQREMTGKGTGVPEFRPGNLAALAESVKSAISMNYTAVYGAAATRSCTRMTRRTGMRFSTPTCRPMWSVMCRSFPRWGTRVPLSS